MLHTQYKQGITSGVVFCGASCENECFAEHAPVADQHKM